MARSSSQKKDDLLQLKIHLKVTDHGQPIEFFLTPGSFSDSSAMKSYQYDLPQKAWITGDKAYTDYMSGRLLSGSPSLLATIAKVEFEKIGQSLGSLPTIIVSKGN